MASHVRTLCNGEQPGTLICATNLSLNISSKLQMHYKAQYISAIPFCITAPDYFERQSVEKIQLHVGTYMLYDSLKTK
jgi:hypothetical protein